MFAHRELRALVLFLAVWGAGLSASPLSAQERRVLANQVTVAANEASLRLEFSEGDPLTVALTNGTLRIDGVEAAPFTPGGALESSWRELLGRIVAADASEIPALIEAWSPPTGLNPPSAAAAELLVDRLAQLPSGTPAQEPLAGAVRIHVGEELTIPMGETVPGSILLVESALTLDGRVAGDVVLIGGSLELGPDARIEGNVRWSGGDIEGNRSAVAGLIEEVPGLTLSNLEATGGPAVDVGSLGDRIREEIRAETREAAANAARRGASRESNSPLSRIGRGLGGILQTIVSFGILLGMGLALLYFFPRRVEIISRTARESTLRSGLVGLAGVVLALPLWVVGIVLLAVSIIGIPLILLWAPGMPLAVACAVTVGYLAVAHNLGRWIFGDEGRTVAGFSGTSPATSIGVGLVVLLGAFALANVFEIGGPWFTIFEHVLLAVGVTLGAIAMSVGLGAVILSRAGQDSTFAGAAWRIEEDERRAAAGGDGGV